ncbi:MAG: DUF2007 domain-containing protein [Acidobacteria bacterium]|jgi:hypothetical protein|nr:DUF2007 domain-containing protein [Acidobacteriota bacterium]
MSDGEDEDPGGGWEVVAEVAKRYEAEFMAGHLRAAGIEARVIDKSFRQEPLPTARSFAIVRVYVPADRLDESKRLLAEAASSPEDGEGQGS